MPPPDFLVVICFVSSPPNEPFVKFMISFSIASFSAFSFSSAT